MFIYNDGGRSQYFKGKAGDCGARAMAIAMNLDYKECYNELAEENKRARGKKSARNGLYKEDFARVLNRHGWFWQSSPKFVGRKAKSADMVGTVIARMANHYAAVIDGVPNDTWDTSRKMVYGYWEKINEQL